MPSASAGSAAPSWCGPLLGPIASSYVAVWRGLRLTNPWLVAEGSLKVFPLMVEAVEVGNGPQGVAWLLYFVLHPVIPVAVVSGSHPARLC
jgi:hypothetical protein